MYASRTDPAQNGRVIRRFTVLGAIFVALVVGDVSARGFVEAKATERAQLEAPPGSVVSASVGGFPFVPPLLLGGSVSQVGIHLKNVSAGVIVFASVDLKLRGVDLDRGLLLKDRKVRILDIDKGSVEVILTEKALGDALHVPVTMADGQISVMILRTAFSVTPTITADGKLTLTGAAGRALTLPIPKLDFVPCLGEVTVLAGRMRLSCEITAVPPALVDAVEQAS